MKEIALTLAVSALVLSGCDQGRAVSGDALAAAGIPGAVPVTSTAEQDSSPMVVRRLWYKHNDNLNFWGSPSPDGRYLSYIDWESSDIALHDFVTGEKRLVTTEGREKQGFPYASKFSPDGESLAYNWDNYENQIEELRIIGLDGSEPRVLKSDAARRFTPIEWTADGKQLLVVITVVEDRSDHIGLVSAIDGSHRVLRALDRYPSRVASISPDGRFVLFDQPATESDDSERDVYVIDTGTGEEWALIENPADDRALAWAPDGRHVLFASDRTGTLGAWLIPVADGRPAGPERLVKPDVWRFKPLGFARNGSFFYGVSLSMRDVHVATLDHATGQLIDRPVRISQSFFGSNMATVWSPDGRYLAYLSARGPEGEENVIVVRLEDTGGIRELEPGIVPLHWPSWAPGSTMIVRSQDADGPAIFSVDMQTGDAEALIRFGPNDYHKRAQWLADGRSLLVWESSSDGSRVRVLDTESGEEAIIHQTETADEWISPHGAISADELFIAFALRYEESADLMVKPVAGGEPRRLAHFENESWPQLVLWGPSGRHIYFIRWGGEDEHVGLWRLPFEGGEPEKLEWLRDAGCTDLRFQPGGQRVALTCSQWGSEVWVMEDFLPTASTDSSDTE